jgi:hypothetical protein
VYRRRLEEAYEAGYNAGQEESFAGGALTRPGGRARCRLEPLWFQFSNGCWLNVAGVQRVDFESARTRCTLLLAGGNKHTLEGQDAARLRRILTRLWLRNGLESRPDAGGWGRAADLAG